MGYGYFGRSPQEVQMKQGRDMDFDTAKQLYESITPLRGVRKSLNVRPIGERDRCHERIVKVSDEEYYITCNAYRWSETRKIKGDEHYKDYNHCRALTFMKNAEQETITIHVPRTYWGDHSLNMSAFCSSSVFYFYKYNMAKGLDFINNQADKYVVIDTDGTKKYYPLEKADVVVYRKNGETQWKILSALRKVVHRVDREKSKKVREIAKPFTDYVATMFPLVEPDHIWGNVITEHLKNEKTNWEGLLTPKGDEIPEEWFKMAQNYKHKAHRTQYIRNDEGRYDCVEVFSNVKEIIKRDLYHVARPFKKVEVPLGEMAHDRNPE